MVSRARSVRLHHDGEIPKTAHPGQGVLQLPDAVFQRRHVGVDRIGGCSKRFAEREVHSLAGHVIIPVVLYVRELVSHCEDKRLLHVDDCIAVGSIAGKGRE